VFYICKGCKVFTKHGNMWLCMLILHECICVVCPTYFFLVEFTFLVMVIKSMKFQIALDIINYKNEMDLKL